MSRDAGGSTRSCGALRRRRGERGGGARGDEPIRHFSAMARLPAPTMSPVETSGVDGWLERPEEAFAYLRKRGFREVVCEEKHIGSTAEPLACSSVND